MPTLGSVGRSASAIPKTTGSAAAERRLLGNVVSPTALPPGGGRGGLGDCSSPSCVPKAGAAVPAECVWFLVWTNRSRGTALVRLARYGPRSAGSCSSSRPLAAGAPWRWRCWVTAAQKGCLNRPRPSGAPQMVHSWLAAFLWSQPSLRPLALSPGGLSGSWLESEG